MAWERNMKGPKEITRKAKKDYSSGLLWQITKRIGDTARFLCTHAFLSLSALCSEHIIYISKIHSPFVNLLLHIQHIWAEFKKESKGFPQQVFFRRIDHCYTISLCIVVCVAFYSWLFYCCRASAHNKVRAAHINVRGSICSE